MIESKNDKINSKQKGAVGERELAQLLRNQGWMDARRGVQYSGLKGDADVVGVQGIHIECKRCQQVSDEKWLQQAEHDARIGEIPVVIYRRNHETWKLLIRQDLADIIWQTLTAEQKTSIRDRVKFMHP
jgi:Holliday junction resolvase